MVYAGNYQKGILCKEFTNHFQISKKIGRYLSALIIEYV